MQLTTFVVTWACLAIVVLALALARYLVSLREEDSIHIGAAEKGLITKQMGIVHQLDSIDRWGKSLTIVTVAFGLVLAGLYLYQRLP
jgi:hypothetical protein